MADDEEFASAGSAPDAPLPEETEVPVMLTLILVFRQAQTCMVAHTMSVSLASIHKPLLRIPAGCAAAIAAHVAVYTRSGVLQSGSL